MALSCRLSAAALLLTLLVAVNEFWLAVGRSGELGLIEPTSCLDLLLAVLLFDYLYGLSQERDLAIVVRSLSSCERYVLGLDGLVLEHHLVWQPSGDVVLLQPLEGQRAAQDLLGLGLLGLDRCLRDCRVKLMGNRVVGVLVVLEKYRPIKVLSD